MSLSKSGSSYIECLPTASRLDFELKSRPAHCQASRLSFELKSRPAHCQASRLSFELVSDQLTAKLAD